MEQSINISILCSGLVSVLLPVLAWFLRQLHTDFRRIQEDISEIKTSSRLIQADMKSADELINQRISYLERHLSILGKQQTEDG